MNTRWMKAALQGATNEPFRVMRVPQPEPGPGQVLVRVAASALNPLDAKIRAGQAPHARQPLPAILGIDVAGTIEALGPNVDSWRVGDKVMGMVGGVGGRQGTLAQYLAVDAGLLAPQPPRLSARVAATLPLAFVTAWEGLVDRARVGTGQTVLIQAGAGGVGHLAIQLARSLGAQVFATGRPTQRAVIEAAGAAFVDIDEAPLGAESTNAFDVVYDTLGGTFLDRSFGAVRPFGHVVSCLGWGSHSLAPLSFKGASYSGVFTLEPLLSGRSIDRLGTILTQAARMAEAGKLTPHVAPQTFSLETVNEAFELLGARSGLGRVVVEVAWS